MTPREKTYSAFVVDADQGVLDRFQRYFQGRNFLAYACRSFHQAQAIMVGVVADIVICRIDSPVAEGTEFLRMVRDRMPRSIRMVMSTEDKLPVLLQLVASGLAQRYLALPWEKNGIAALLTQDLKTRSRIRTRKCWAYLESGRHLPVVPAVISQVEEVLAQPKFRLEQLVAIVEKEPVISARLLQVVNSSAFLKSGRITDLQLAISYLGVDNLRELLLYISAIEAFPVPASCRSWVHGVTRHSFQCSRMARLVAATLAPGMERRASTAALLHDIGKLLFLANSCKLFGRFEGTARGTTNFWPPESFFEENFGFSHSELGSCLLLWWNLPMTIVEIVASSGCELGELSGVCRVVAVAHRLLVVAGSGRHDLELEALAQRYPVHDWLASARQMLDQKG